MKHEEGKKEMKMRHITLVLLSFTVVASFFLLSGCEAKPDETTVKETISRYFQERHYDVLEIDIAEISSIPLKSRVYMGPEGYIVKLRSITLKAMENSGAPQYYRKGQVLTFRHALVGIRAGKKGGWLVSNVSGITVL